MVGYPPVISGRRPPAQCRRRCDGYGAGPPSFK